MKKTQWLLYAGMFFALVSISIVTYLMIHIQIDKQDLDKTNQKATEIQEQFNSLPTKDTLPLRDNLSLRDSYNNTKEDSVKEDVALVIPSRVGVYEDFGLLYIPALGENYKGVITAGDDTEDIYGGLSAINYYDSATMPGELGNFTLAGHKGGKFDKIIDLKKDNIIVVETKEGYYEYKVTGSDIVFAEQVEVLYPVPYTTFDTKPSKAIITLTSCYYDGLIKKRIIVFGDFINYYPRNNNTPTDLLNIVGKPAGVS